MMPSPDIFPVPLIRISETNSTNNYLQSLCSEQKVGGINCRCRRFSNFRSGTAWQFLGIRSWQEPSFQHRYLPRVFGSTTSVSHFTDYIFSY